MISTKMQVLTENVISTNRAGVGRKQINHEQTPLRLPEGTLARVDAVLAEGEKRADLLRVAVETELQKREHRHHKRRRMEGNEHEPG